MRGLVWSCVCCSWSNDFGWNFIFSGAMLLVWWRLILVGCWIGIGCSGRRAILVLNNFARANIFIRVYFVHVILKFVVIFIFLINGISGRHDFHIPIFQRILIHFYISIILCISLLIFPSWFAYSYYFLFNLSHILIIIRVRSRILRFDLSLPSASWNLSLWLLYCGLVLVSNDFLCFCWDIS